jgi:hypothetical protein
MKRRVSSVPVGSNRPTLDESLNSYVDKMGEKFKEIFPPTPQPDWSKPLHQEPPVFHATDVCPATDLANRIIGVIDGYTIETIMVASNIVEQHVLAQSRGKYFGYVPTILGK